jgi:cobyrinic acid a,c-diamide synthase
MTARLVIAGTHSGVGKTTLTAGIIAVLRRRGMTVQPFKVGPDYIDPTYHALAAGQPCRNLDTWMLPPERVQSLFTHATADADVAIIEGVMGLYDGADYDGDIGSTAEVAKLLAAPVVVVLDASKMARSGGAVAVGYQRFDNGVPLAGFLVNRVAGDSHGRGVASAITKATGLPVLGWLPREEALHVPERHLGLIPTNEPGRWDDFLRAACDVVARHLDIDHLLVIAQQAQPLCGAASVRRFCQDRQAEAAPLKGNRPVIAVARDEAFQFTYEDNLDLLRAAGAEIVFFSPLRDVQLPPRTGGVILSGGFPEVYAAQLAGNCAMHAAVRAVHRQGLPIYAECGGLMYLTRAIIDADRRTHEMVGLLPGRSVMSGRLTLGYRLACAAGDSWLLPRGETVRGHEFHYSTWEDRPADLPPAWTLLPRTGEGQPRPEGASVVRLWASYVHLHFAARPGLAERFVAAARLFAGGGA